MTMELRRLGTTDIMISRVIYGALARRADIQATEAEQIASLHAALDAGVNAIDTAPMYGLGASELLVGRAIRDRRDQVVVMTKAGVTWDDPRGQPLFTMIGPDSARHRISANGRARNIRTSVEASLVRLGVAEIDVLQLHHPDPRTPAAETFGVLAELVRQGKIRAIGVCNHSAVQLELARAAVPGLPIVSLQLAQNLIVRSGQDAIARAREAGMSVFAHAPLEHGMLGGTATPERKYDRDDSRDGLPEFKAKNRALVSALLEQIVKPIAERHRASLAQIAIAWVLARPAISAVIVGASTPAQALDNARAAEIRLEAEELEALDSGFRGFELDHRPDRSLPALLRRLERRIASSFVTPSAEL